MSPSQGTANLLNPERPVGSQRRGCSGAKARHELLVRADGQERCAGAAGADPACSGLGGSFRWRRRGARGRGNDLRVAGLLVLQVAIFRRSVSQRAITQPYLYWFSVLEAEVRTPRIGCISTTVEMQRTLTTLPRGTLTRSDESRQRVQVRRPGELSVWGPAAAIAAGRGLSGRSGAATAWGRRRSRWRFGLRDTARNRAQGIATWSWCHARESLPRHTGRPQRLPWSVRQTRQSRGRVIAAQ